MTNEEAKDAKRQWYLDCDAEKERHKKANEVLQLRAEEIRKACPHDDVTCYSGGPYDSGGYYCEVCRKDLGDHPPKKCRVEC
jgi:hypothetical protein